MQISMFDGEKPYKINKPIRLIELFAGIGSQAKALKNIDANFEHFRICEFDKYAVLSYNAIHGTNFATSDITTLTAKDLNITETDKYEYIMTYSFPCQDLSLAGKRAGMSKGSGTRSGLLWEVERLLTECKELPQVLLMENVSEVHGAKNENNFFKWIEKLENLGYRNYWQDLNAEDFGIPQNRNRTFMISLLGDYYYHFPKPLPLVRNFYLDKDDEEKIERMYYINNPKIINTINKEIGTWSKINPSIAVTQTSRQMTNWRGNFIRDKRGLRFATPEELFFNMGFEKKDATLCRKAGVPNSQLYKQAGNSIVVKVLEAIFKQMTAKVEEVKE